MGRVVPYLLPIQLTKYLSTMRAEPSEVIANSQNLIEAVEFLLKVERGWSGRRHRQRGLRLVLLRRTNRAQEFFDCPVWQLRRDVHRFKVSLELVLALLQVVYQIGQLLSHTSRVHTSGVKISRSWV